MEAVNKMAMEPDKRLEGELLDMLDSIQNLYIELDDKIYCFDLSGDPKDGAYELFIYLANEEQMEPEERQVPLSTQYLILSVVLNHIKDKIDALKLESENHTIRIFKDMPQMKGGT
jgi:hypothetical protein